MSSQHPHQDEAEEPDPSVDWEKVGKTYNQDTKLDTVMEREFSRLNKALEEKLAIQDASNNEKLAAGKK